MVKSFLKCMYHKIYQNWKFENINDFDTSFFHKNDFDTLNMHDLLLILFQMVEPVLKNLNCESSII